MSAKVPVLKLLPMDARNMLRAAASIDDGVPYGESEDRLMAVDSAIFRVRLMYPNLFQKER